MNANFTNRSFRAGILACGLSLSMGSFGATYTFQSANYATIIGAPGLTAAMRVDGSFVANYLSPNLVNHDISGAMTQYSFTNGVDTFTQLNSVPCTFYVSTDSQGRITQYVADLRESPAPPTGSPMKFLDFYNPGWTGADSGTGPSPGTSCGALSPNNRAYTAPDAYGTWVSPLRPSTTAIPTLSQWGCLVLSALLFATSWVTLRAKDR